MKAATEIRDSYQRYDKRGYNLNSDEFVWRANGVKRLRSSVHFNCSLCGPHAERVPPLIQIINSRGQYFGWAPAKLSAIKCGFVHRTQDTATKGLRLEQERLHWTLPANALSREESARSINRKSFASLPNIGLPLPYIQPVFTLHFSTASTAVLSPVS